MTPDYPTLERVAREMTIAKEWTDEEEHATIRAFRAAWNPETALAVCADVARLRAELRQCEADNTAACDERDALRERVEELEDQLHDYVVAEPAGWQDLRDERDTALARAEAIRAPARAVVDAAAELPLVWAPVIEDLRAALEGT